MDRCDICEEPPDDYGLVLLFTSRYHVYKGCVPCEIAYQQLKDWEYERKETEKGET
jgi:hypothetical protein